MDSTNAHLVYLLYSLKSDSRNKKKKILQEKKKENLFW